MIEYVIIGYLILTSIIIGVMLHLNKMPFEACLLSALWPFMIAALPFIGIAALTKKILDKIDKTKETK